MNRIISGSAALIVASTCLIGTPVNAQDTSPPQNLEPVKVQDQYLRENWRAKLEYIQPEVDGAFITVTKKSSITKLEKLPTIVDNNLRAVFAQTPGLFYSEQQTPGQVNLSYRGIGNPQESEFVGVFQDGIPLEGDWIGFPTLYVFPLPQTIEQVQLVRGGSSLLYGPEPPPTVNLVSRKPVADKALAGYTENVVGNNGMAATFNQISGTSGVWDYLADIHYRTNDGQRDNGDSKLKGTDLHIGYRPSDQSYTALDFHAYLLDTGSPGKLSYPQYQADEDQTTTPYDRLWTDRYVLSLSHEQRIDGDTTVYAKLWAGYQDQASRSQGRGAAPTTSTLQDEQFRFDGTDVRAVHHWGRGNALTIGTTIYHSDAPFRQWTEAGREPQRYDRNGVPILRQQRSTDYAAVFAENVFRLPNRWHIVPSVRLERENVDIDETVHIGRSTLFDGSVSHFVPLFGLGVGNDFGHLNESYFNVSQGWRPVRYFDVSSPFGSLDYANNDPDPTHALSWEGGAHGTPLPGLFYDASLFWVTVKDRIEGQPTGVGNNTINVNTGDTRHRGFEGQIDYDFLAAADPQTSSHLSLFGNLSLLNAEFTATRNPANLGNEPAFSPHYLLRTGVAYREDKHLKLALSLLSVGSQYFQDSNLPIGTPTAATYVPAKVPQYTVTDFSADWWVLPQVRLLGGISNIANRKYYSRVFQSAIEPGLGRTYYAGFAVEF